MADDFSSGFSRGLGLVGTFKDIKDKKTASETKREHKQEYLNIAKAMTNKEGGGIDKATNEIKSQEGLKFLNDYVALQDYESPKEKRQGDVLKGAIKDGIDMKKIYATAEETGRPIGNLISEEYGSRYETERKDKMFDRAKFLTTKYDAHVKDFHQVSQLYTAMEESYKYAMEENQWIGGDQALIMIFNKLLDPESVVRESEYARTGQNMPFIEEWRGKLLKLKEGGAGLTKSQRAMLRDTIRTVFSQTQDYYRKQRKNYQGQSEKWEVPNHEMVIGDDFSVNLHKYQYADGVKPPEFKQLPDGRRFQSVFDPYSSSAKPKWKPISQAQFDSYQKKASE